MKYLFITAICFFAASNGFAQQNKFEGIWSNTRYQRITGYVDRISATRNPRFIKIAADGRCTVMNDPEHMVDLWLPISKKKNGNEEELTYKGKLTYVITTNDSIGDFISLEIANSGFHILLTKIKE